MMMSVFSGARLALALLSAATLAGCAFSRSEIAVVQTVPPDPAAGVVVVISSAVDERRFEVSPREPSVPSLKEPAQIGDAQITSRALGRKRNTYGAALGDVLLTPPQTAATLVGDAVKSGLRDAGYRVIDGGDPAQSRAQRLTIRVVEFWIWVTPGFSIKLDHSTSVVLQGDLPAVRQAVTLNVRDTKGYGIITEADWLRLFRRAWSNFA